MTDNVEKIEKEYSVHLALPLLKKDVIYKYLVKAQSEDCSKVNFIFESGGTRVSFSVEIEPDSVRHEREKKEREEKNEGIMREDLVEPK